MRIIKILFLSLLFNGCSLNTTYLKNVPYESFVRVDVEVAVEKCQEQKKSNTSICVKEKFLSSGSGSVIHHDLNHTYVLTAAHVCMIDDGSMKGYNITKNITLRTVKKQAIDAEVYRVHPDFIQGGSSMVDLCLIRTKEKIKLPRLRMSLIAPRVGDKVYNLASPGGFFFPPSVPLFSGYFSGNLNKYHGLITVPAIGGSSGSPVLNEKGELVAILFAANMQMHHLSIVVNYDFVKDFLKENLYGKPSF